MDVSFVLVGIASILLAYIVYLIIYSKFFELNLPPGPYGVPILGYAPFLKRQTHRELEKLGKKYGPVFSIQLGNKLVIVLHDWKAIKTALVDQNDDFGGRPYHEYVKRIGHTGKGLIINDGPSWKLNRRLALSTMREFGVGKNILESNILRQIEDVWSILDESGKNGVDMRNVLFCPLLNIVWEMLSGKRFEHDDPEGIVIRDTVVEQLSLFGTHNYYFLPKIIRTITGLGEKNILRLSKCFHRITSYLAKEVDNRRASIENKEESNYIIDILLAKSEKQKQSQDIGPDFITDDDVVMTANDLFIGGVETTTNTLAWGIQYIVRWPKVQDKIQEELDRVVGRDRMPTLDDRNNLPYVNAAVFEVQRMCSVLPLSVTRRVKKRTTLLGYDIPKDASVLPNLWAVFREPTLWGSDVDVFRPERFLDKDGQVVKPDYFIPYGMGSRICIGESLAKMELFVYFSQLLHRYRFDRLPGEPFPDLKDTFGSTLGAPKYKVMVTRRW